MTSAYKQQAYLMKNQEEGQRLELKTNREPVKCQSAWAGIDSGSITTAVLTELVGSNSHVTGLGFQKPLTSILMPVAAYGRDYEAFRDAS